MRTRRLATALAVLITPTIAYAQRTAADTTPTAGTWGAEVYLGSGVSGASLLRFTSPNLAFLFGADFNVTHVESDGDETVNPGPTTQTNLTARLGFRNYRHSSAERLRPVIGGGLRTTYAKGPLDSRAWTAGVYGELGAAYFLTPHVSLGGSGEVAASYGKRKQFVGIMNLPLEQTTTTVSATLMRVMLAVYF